MVPLITQKLVLAIWGLCWYNFFLRKKGWKRGRVQGGPEADGYEWGEISPINGLNG